MPTYKYKIQVKLIAFVLAQVSLLTAAVCPESIPDNKNIAGIYIIDNKLRVPMGFSIEKTKMPVDETEKRMINASNELTKNDSVGAVFNWMEIKRRVEKIAAAQRKQIRYNCTYPAEIVLNALELNPNDVYLNLAGGPGIYTLIASRHYNVKQAVYLDISEANLLIAEHLLRNTLNLTEQEKAALLKLADKRSNVNKIFEKLSNRGVVEHPIPENVRLVLSDARNMPEIGDNSIDKLSVIELFAWLEEGGDRRCIKEMLRVIRPGGRIFIAYDFPLERGLKKFENDIKDIAAEEGIEIDLRRAPETGIDSAIIIDIKNKDSKEIYPSKALLLDISEESMNKLVDIFKDVSWDNIEENILHLAEIDEFDAAIYMLICFYEKYRENKNGKYNKPDNKLISRLIRMLADLGYKDERVDIITARLIIPISPHGNPDEARGLLMRSKNTKNLSKLIRIKAILDDHMRILMKISGYMGPYSDIRFSSAMKAAEIIYDALAERKIFPDNFKGTMYVKYILQKLDKKRVTAGHKETGSFWILGNRKLRRILARNIEEIRGISLYGLFIEYEITPRFKNIADAAGNTLKDFEKIKSLKNRIKEAAKYSKEKNNLDIMKSAIEEIRITINARIESIIDTIAELKQISEGSRKDEFYNLFGKKVIGENLAVKENMEKIAGLNPDEIRRKKLRILKKIKEYAEAAEKVLDSGHPDVLPGNQRELQRSI